MAIPARVTMQEMGTFLPPLHGEVFAWLGRQGVAPAGAPFWRYVVIDMEAGFEMEVGVPVASAVPGGDRVFAGVLPARRYATLRHSGYSKDLYEATRALLEWAEQNGLAWQTSASGQGEA